jgi:DNA-directed RNA polymerase subunit M/transcription elongation factor TFIIS
MDSQPKAVAKKAQRNTKVAPEMADTEAPKTKSKKTAAAPKKAAPQAAPQAANNIGAIPEGALAVADEQGGAGAPLTMVKLTPPDLGATVDDASSSLKFCPVCENYLYTEVDAESQELTRLCRKCGHKEQDTKGGLVMEMMIQQRSAEGYKILLNEFTRKDPRLPHIRKNISCPNAVCDSNKGGKDPDVIYIKYDVVNLMYLYICDICGEKWHSRARN